MAPGAALRLTRAGIARPGHVPCDDQPPSARPCSAPRDRAALPRPGRHGGLYRSTRQPMHPWTRKADVSWIRGSEDGPAPGITLGRSGPGGDSRRYGADTGPKSPGLHIWPRGGPARTLGPGLTQDRADWLGSPPTPRGARPAQAKTGVAGMSPHGGDGWWATAIWVTGATEAFPDRVDPCLVSGLATRASRLRRREPERCPRQARALPRPLVVPTARCASPKLVEPDSRPVRHKHRRLGWPSRCAATGATERHRAVPGRPRAAPTWRETTSCWHGTTSPGHQNGSAGKIFRGRGMATSRPGCRRGSPRAGRQDRRGGGRGDPLGGRRACPRLRRPPP